MADEAKIWVIVTTPMAGIEFSYVAGDLAELPASIANDMVEAGYAKAITKTDAQDLKRIQAKLGLKLRVG